jgi:hypothetical protein
MAYWQKDIPKTRDMNIGANTEAITITIPCTYKLHELLQTFLHSGWGKDEHGT